MFCLSSHKKVVFLFSNMNRTYWAFNVGLIVDKPCFPIAAHNNPFVIPLQSFHIPLLNPTELLTLSLSSIPN